MVETIISVEDVGKKYIINHQGKERYKALRDVFSQGIKSLQQKILNPSVAENSTLSREEFWALKDVSFEIKRGDRVGIIGRNGAGKSTLLKILSRIVEPTKGRIHIRGRVASLLEVGTGFHPELTGRENIYLNGAILGMSKVEIKNKFDEIVAFAEVEQFLDTPVKRYSSGMYVRLAFSVAAHLEPEILIVDEVLAVGDAQFQAKCLGKMEDVSNQEGRTVLFVSHNMPTIESLCSKAVLLSHGRVAAVDEVNPVINLYYADTFARTQVILEDRPDRKGSRKARLTSLQIVNADCRYDAIRCSARIEIQITYTAPQKLSNCIFLFAIVDRRGVPIYWLDSRYDPKLPINLPENGSISCVTAPLNLIPGTYFVNAALLVNGELADQVESASSIVIEPEDFFGVGTIPDRQHGSCLLAQAWGLK